MVIVLATVLRLRAQFSFETFTIWHLGQEFLLEDDWEAGAEWNEGRCEAVLEMSMPSI